MALDDIQKKIIPSNNDFYRNHYHQVFLSVIVIFFLMVLLIGVLSYQMLNRPLPQFNAVQPDGKTMLLIPNEQPNLMPPTILRWATKAATLAYTFDFANYNKQIALARPYFTEDGWQDYLASVRGLINTIVQRQLFVYGVVSGPPVISNQGPLPGKGYVWRVQIPFLVSYLSANESRKISYYVILSIVQVPTSVNEQAIGIDQFVMV